jgi:hypothetical protein
MVPKSKMKVKVFNLSDKVSLLKGSMSLTEVGWHDGKK